MFSLTRLDINVSSISRLPGNRKSPTFMVNGYNGHNLVNVVSNKTNRHSIKLNYDLFYS